VVEQHHSPDNHQNETRPQTTGSASQVHVNITRCGFAELALNILVDAIMDVPVDLIVQVLAELVRVEFVFAAHGMLQLTVSRRLLTRSLRWALFLGRTTPDCPASQGQSYRNRCKERHAGERLHTKRRRDEGSHEPAH